ncbi:MAG: hypothetical protein L0H54_12290, partial [Alcaligenaceae bacterium]|nr:hypothetical protein [Alcaligenaceae bacterium]
MNLSPVVPTSPTPAPADVARAAEPTGESGFDNVLAQQKGQAVERTTSAAGDSRAPAQSTESDERQAQTPEETLALLAAGAVLPWTPARTDATSPAGTDPKAPRVPADRQAIMVASGGAVASDASAPRSSHNALPNQATPDSSIRTRTPAADLAAGALPARSTGEQPFAA